MRGEIEIPVKACGRCEAAYTLTEWRSLSGPLDKAEEDQREWRVCVCGDNLSLDVRGLDDLDLKMPAAAYYAAFPESRRVATSPGYQDVMVAMRLRLHDAKERERRAMVVAWVLCGVVTALVAALAWVLA